MVAGRLLSLSLVLVLSLSMAWSSLPVRPARAAGGPVAFAVQSDNDPDTLYRIDLTTGVATLIGVVGSDDIEGLAFGCNGVLYGVDDEQQVLYKLDLTTGAGTVVGPLGVSVDHPGLTVDDQGRLWMADEDNENLYRINPQTGAATLIGPIGFPITALAFSGGTLYGIDPSNARLIAINPSTGAGAVVGPLGISIDEGGMDADANGTVWGVEDLGGIFTVNLQTGAATPVSTTIAGFESLAIDTGCGTRATGANNDDEKPKETKLQQQQRERTNRRGLEDYKLEGNVTAVGKDDGGSFLVLANRDGLVTVRLHRDAAKTKVCVGYYVQVAGEKEHEFLYDAEDLSIDKKSDSKDCIN